jgi:hypothetical protein
MARKHNGDPLGNSRLSNGVSLAYYLAHVDDETDECILWPYYADQDGYGQLRFNGTYAKVHALACERRHGPRPPGMLALHAPVVCHNPSCFNWRHLSWGTLKQNAEHKALDGTSHAGERNPRARLTREDVAEMRARYAAGGILQRELAAEYGVAVVTASQIIRGRSWRIP